MTTDSSTNRELAEYLADAFRQVDWPIPPYLNLGFLSPLAKAIKDAPQDGKLAIMREQLAAESSKLAAVYAALCSFHVGISA